jgi:hypothetical protein
MKSFILTGASVAAVLLAGSVLTAAELKSGPQEGQKVTPFNPLHVTGSTAGQKLCLV